jgi:hypothetical protein
VKRRSRSKRERIKIIMGEPQSGYEEDKKGTGGTGGRGKGSIVKLYSCFSRARGVY